MTKERMLAVIEARFGPVSDHEFINSTSGDFSTYFKTAGDYRVSISRRDNKTLWLVRVSNDDVRLCGEGPTLNDALAQIREHQTRTMLAAIKAPVPIQKTHEYEAL